MSDSTKPTGAPSASNMKNHAAVTAGFRVLRGVLAPHIGQVLSNKGAENWWKKEVLSNLGERERKYLPKNGENKELIDSLDINPCLRLLTHKNHIEDFKAKISNYDECYKWATYLWNVHNDWAHICSADFTDEDTDRAFEIMLRLSMAINPDSALEFNLIREYNVSADESADIPNTVRNERPVPAHRAVPIHYVKETSDWAKAVFNYAVIGIICMLAAVTVYNQYFFKPRSSFTLNYERDTDSDIRSAEYYFGQGTLYEKMGNHAQAVEYFSDAILAAPNEAMFYTSRANSHEKMGDHQKAIDDYTEAIRINPNRIEFYTGRARLHEITGGFLKAIADYSQAVRIDSNRVDLYESRADLYWKTGAHEKAIEDYSQAIAIDSDRMEFYTSRGDLHVKTGDHEKAAADYTQAIRLAPFNVVNRINRGKAYRSMRLYGRAIEDFSALIQFDPKVPQYYIDRGSVYEDMGEYEKAISDFTEAIRLEPGNISYYLARSGSHNKSNDHKKALEDIAAAIRIDSTNSALYAGRGNVYISMREYGRAADEFRKAMRINPGNTEYPKRLVEALQGAGPAESAEPHASEKAARSAEKAKRREPAQAAEPEQKQPRRRWPW
ncbi:MAG: tetratricopeptide repeat protein [Chitinispirillia bacterium]|nr:tetratricopeptide repeat protein [Chitinispirillia bacterium]